MDEDSKMIYSPMIKVNLQLVPWGIFQNIQSISVIKSRKFKPHYKFVKGKNILVLKIFYCLSFIITIFSIFQSIILAYKTV